MIVAWSEGEESESAITQLRNHTAHGDGFLKQPWLGSWQATARLEVRGWKPLANDAKPGRPEQMPPARERWWCQLVQTSLAPVQKAFCGLRKINRRPRARPGGATCAGLAGSMVIWAGMPPK